MKKSLLFAFLVLVCLSSLVNAQTPGLIYKPSTSTLGKQVLDPNNDGYVSATDAGFTTTTDYGTASELQMIPLPYITSEPANDLTTGSGGGHTDIVSNGTGQSVYALVRTVNSVDYLIVRFRLGGASTSPKGYSLLLDTDGVFGNYYTSSNPGFEREIVLEAGNGVRIYSHGASGTTVLQTYSVDDYQQRSVAASTVSGNTDYFYDFFVPLSAINATNYVRIVAATITSAQSGISGSISDFNGVNDTTYKGNRNAMFNDLISGFPQIHLTDLRSGYTFPQSVSLTPSVNNNLTTASTTITGTSLEANGTTISVYRNGVLLGSTTVTGGTWTYNLSGVTLALGDVVTARATATGKSQSAVSPGVTVTLAASCYTPAPVISSRANGSQTLSGTWSNGSTITANTVQLRFYYTDLTTHAFVEDTSVSNVYVDTAGSWTVTRLGGGSQSTFAGRAYFVTATFNGCTSLYSNSIAGGNGSGTKTPTPSITTATLYASTGATTVTVQNLHTAAATLYLYVNSTLVGTQAGVAANGTYNFSYTGFREGDIVVARAWDVTTANYYLSDFSASKTVISNVQTTAPVITGTYVAGTQTVSGTSSEAPGTTITLYIGGTASSYTTTVDSYGNWSIASVPLTSGQVVTARAKATGKTLSADSNSVTVAAAAPSAPVVTSPIYAGATSIPGTSGVNVVNVYVDGSRIGNVTATGAWTLSSVVGTNLYRGAVVTARNLSTAGIESVASNSVVVQGVVSYLITDTSGNALTSKVSGQTFDIRITAKDAASGAGNTVTTFTGKVVVTSDAGMLLGSGTTINFVNGVATHTVALADVGTGKHIYVVNVDDPTATGSATLDIVEAIWRGTNSTAYNVASNWVYNFVPLDGSTIRFAEPTVNHCLLDQDRSLNVISNNQTDYRLNLNGHKLSLEGSLNFTNSAKIEATTTGSVLNFFSKDAQALNAATVYNATMYGIQVSGTGTTTLSGALSLTGVLTLTSGQFVTGNNLTFKSSATQTAIVTPVTGSVSGSVIVERYIPARRAYRFLSSPVTSPTTINENWQEGVNNTATAYPSGNLNPNPGFGTHIAGSTTGALGFDATLSGNPSMFVHDNSTATWSAINNTNTITLSAGDVYRVMVRGDRSINLTTNTPTPTVTVLRTRGTLYTGNKAVTNFNQNANGVSFIGNPYQSPVDVKTFLLNSTNLLKGYYYLWDATQGTRGAYVTVDMTGTSDVATLGLANRYVQPGQGFMVRTSAAGSASATFTESLKQISTAYVPVFRQSEANKLLRFTLYDQAGYAAGNTALDGFFIKFAADGNNAIDELDAKKPGNQDENFAIGDNVEMYSVQTRALPQNQEVIQLFSSQYRFTDYALKMELEPMEGVTAYLHDNYLNTNSPIVAGEPVMYNFSVDSSVAESVASNRFSVLFNVTALSTEEVKKGNIYLYPNPANEKVNLALSSAEEAAVMVYNTLGQAVPVKTVQSGVNVVITTEALSEGIYLVNVKQGNVTTTKKLYISKK